jgi:FkbM family methyltransferase
VSREDRAAHWSIVTCDPPIVAKLQLFIMRVAGKLIGHTVKRGVGTAIGVFGRLFPSNTSAVVDLGRGTTIKLMLHDAYWWGPLFQQGFYEPEIARVLDNVLQADTTFIDCGASNGWWSVYALGLRQVGQIIAIEASPIMFSELVSNSDRNGGGITCVNKAIWASSGNKVDFWTDSERFSWSSASPSVIETLKTEGFRCFRVPTIGLDDLTKELIPDRAIKIVIKLDVEGVERQVIEGAAQTLEREALLIYEDHGRDSEHLVTRALEQKYRFSIYRCHPNGSLQRSSSCDLAEFCTDVRKGYNLVACRPESAMDQRLRGLLV